jgi:hypothetical protein
MSIIPPPVVKIVGYAATNIPDWPMPGNIKDFKGINLKLVPLSEFITIIFSFQLCGQVHPQFLGKISRKFPLDRCEHAFSSFSS